MNGRIETLKIGSLLHSRNELRLELKLALAVLTLGIFILFVFAKLNLGAETIRALQVGKLFLDMTPLAACKFHDLLLFPFLIFWMNVRKLSRWNLRMSSRNSESLGSLCLSPLSMRRFMNPLFHQSGNAR